MNGAKLILSGGICLVVVGTVGPGCGPSSSSPEPGADSGLSSDVHETDPGAEAGQKSCNPFALDLCPQGQTCCFSGLAGMCTPVGACYAPFRVACWNTQTCSGNGVCCASVQFATGNLGDGSVSADLEGGGFALTYACESRCVFPEFQVCMYNWDCQNGEVCANVSPPNRTPVFTCIPPDAGLGLAEDASPTEDVVVPDASDAGSDAPDRAGASDAAGDAPNGG